MNINVRSPGAEDLSRRFAALVKDLQNLGPFIKFVGPLTVRAVQRNFRAEKSSNGIKWPRLRYRIGGTPLYDHGDMFKGITFAPRSKGYVVGAGEETKAFNRVHNFGSKKWKTGEKWQTGKFKGQRKYVPQREFMFLTKAAVHDLAREAQAFVARRLKK